MESNIPGVTIENGRIALKSGKKTANGGFSYLFPVKEKEAVSESPSAESGILTALKELKDQYAEELRRGYDYAAEKLKAERDDNLREQYIKNRQEIAALPEELALRGINGGGTETTLANLKALYQNERGKARKTYSDKLGELSEKTQEKKAEGLRSYDSKWLDYLFKKLLNEGK